MLNIVHFYYLYCILSTYSELICKAQINCILVVVVFHVHLQKILLFGVYWCRRNRELVLKLTFNHNIAYCIHRKHPVDTLVYCSLCAATVRRHFRRYCCKSKTTSGRFTTFAGYLHWGVSFSGKEISLILKNKMGATGISLKIIYIFLLAVSHR